MLAGPYGPPLHPILVTVPIGAWSASLIFDIADRIVDKPGFLTEGSEWLIGIGILGALAAAMFGFLDLLAIPAGTRAFRTGLIHMSLNLSVTVATRTVARPRRHANGMPSTSGRPSFTRARKREV